MPRLYQFTLDPYSRRTRLQLSEKGQACQLIDERPWTPSAPLLDLNPSGLVPVFVEDTGLAICGSEALSEYLEEAHPTEKTLLPGNAYQRAEIRRLVAWFDVKFYTEVCPNPCSLKKWSSASCQRPQPLIWPAFVQHCNA